MKKSILPILFIFSVYFALFSTAHAYVSKSAILMHTDNKLQTKNNEITASSFEKSLSEQELLDTADLIVTGEIVKVKERAMKTFDTTASDGQKLNITMPVIVYEVKVLEELKNSQNKYSTIELAMTDTNTDISIETGKEYVMYVTKKNKQNSEYSLVSMSQAVYTFTDDHKKIKLLSGGTSVDYNGFKEKVKALKNK